MSFTESNNPTIDKLINTYNAFEILGLMNEDLREDSALLDVVKNFNSTFKTEGWVLNNYLSFDTCQDALLLAEKGDLAKANIALIKGVTKGIELFMSHLPSSKEFNDRRSILENAHELYLQNNHSATIPLLLIALDGISNDITNLGLFAQNSNLRVWDSITQYEETFTYIQENFLTKSRTKTNLEEIYLPYRNGILHGRDVNFSNSHVSAKCWNILFTLRTWYLENKEDQKIKNEIIDNYLIAFKERSNESNFTEDFGVINVTTKFFDSWKKKRWGEIVPLMYHLDGKHRGKAAKDVKDTYLKYELIDYKIVSFSNKNPSSACVQSVLNILINGEIKEFTINLRVNYSSDNLSALPIGHPKGKWGILQNSLSVIIFQ